MNGRDIPKALPLPCSPMLYPRVAPTTPSPVRRAAGTGCDCTGHSTACSAGQWRSRRAPDSGAWQGNLQCKAGLTFPTETQILRWLEGTLKIIWLQSPFHGQRRSAASPHGSPPATPGRLRMGWGRGSGDSSCRCKYSRDSALTVMQMVTSREAAADLHDNSRECHPPTASPAFPVLGAGAGVSWALGCCPCPNPRAIIETCHWEGGSHKFKRVN